jgi:hypothetical protein
MIVENARGVILEVGRTWVRSITESWDGVLRLFYDKDNEELRQRKKPGKEKHELNRSEKKKAAENNPLFEK